MYKELATSFVNELLKYYPRADISLECRTSSLFNMGERSKETSWILYVREEANEIMFIQNKSLAVIANEVRSHLRGKDILRAFNEMNKELTFNQVIKEIDGGKR